MKSGLIAIAGGIGSGKSVVSSMLRAMGCEVYDCDSRAKALMDADEAIKRDISTLIAEEAVTPQGAIDRRALADKVFNDARLLGVLNGIVHEAVRRDLVRWRNSLDCRVAWVESAIVHESGLDALVDEIWEVTAPEELRIRRVINRSGLLRDEIERRMAAQSGTRYIDGVPVKYIINDDVAAVLPQLLDLLHRC